MADPETTQKVFENGHKLGYLTIVDYQHYIHYKERNISSWIKLPFALLDDYKFNQLGNDERWFFLGLMLLAGKHDNKIPNDINFLKKKILFDDTNNKTISKMISNLISLELVYTESIQSLESVYTESSQKRRDK